MKKAIICIFFSLLVTSSTFSFAQTPQRTESEENLEYVDLGLPSGTLWKSENEGNLNCNINYTNRNLRDFGDQLPTKEQMEELINLCGWEWALDSNKCLNVKMIGPNGKSIILPLPFDEIVGDWNTLYWTSSSSGLTRDGEDTKWGLLCRYTDRNGDGEYLLRIKIEDKYIPDGSRHTYVRLVKSR